MANREIDIHPIEFIVPGKTTVHDQPCFVSLQADGEREIIVCEHRLCHKIPLQKKDRRRRTTYTSRSADVRARGSKLAAKDALVVLEGGDSGPVELPAAPGLMTVVDLALYRSLERRIDADHLLGTCVAHRVTLCQRASPNRPCVSFPLCAFFGGGRFVGPLRWLMDHRQTMESCSLNRLPLRGSRVVFVLFTWSCRARMMADCCVWKN